MQNYQNITPLILTFNEAPNIERTLSQLLWAHRIVVVDSFSTDETLKILEKYTQVEVFQNKFASFADQCNFGLRQIKTDWVLSIDADYFLSNEVLIEIKKLNFNESKIVAYSAQFKYAIFGKIVRGSMYPSRKILYVKNLAYYENDGHGHRVNVNGSVETLNGFIIHDDRKTFTHWLSTQDKYLKQEADKLIHTPFNQLKWIDKIRWLIVPAPIFAFFYCLFLKGGILDGKYGWHYAMQRVIAEIILSIRLTEARITGQELGIRKQYSTSIELEHLNTKK